jgi:hypothetical protein
MRPVCRTSHHVAEIGRLWSISRTFAAVTAVAWGDSPLAVGKHERIRPSRRRPITKAGRVRQQVPHPHGRFHRTDSRLFFPSSATRQRLPFRNQLGASK